MLKPEVEQSQIKVDGAAAFGRLCVETEYAFARHKY